MGKTFPLTKDFNPEKKIGIVILDDDVKVGLYDILSVEFITTAEKKLKLESFSLIDGGKYCEFREKGKEDLEKLKNRVV